MNKVTRIPGHPGGTSHPAGAQEEQEGQHRQKQKPAVALEQESVAGEEDPGAALDLPEGDQQERGLGTG